MRTPAALIAARSTACPRAEVYASRKSNRPVVSAAIARAHGIRRTPASPAASRSLARSWIQRVMSVPAGPPSGGLYLHPPSEGGLCDGVTTIPSAGGRRPDALWARIARDRAGVGVYPPRAS